MSTGKSDVDIVTAHDVSLLITLPTAARRLFTARVSLFSSPRFFLLPVFKMQRRSGCCWVFK